MSADGHVRWGILGVARIAMTKVIPAMQQGRVARVEAIASREIARAREAAAAAGIPRAYGSYDALLADPDIDAVYIALPNHLHLPWSTRAADAGKHVLCEKPIGLDAREAEALVAVRDRTGVQIQEAFMVRTHPQWTGVIDLIRRDRIGQVRAMVGAFSFFNDDLANIRNIAAFGGGALLDIGCYLVHTARWVFGCDPASVLALAEADPRSGVDRLTSMLLDFGTGHAIGTCSTQQIPYQRIQILGTRGRIEIEIPFNAPPDRPTQIFVGNSGTATETLTVETCNQYTIEADRFSEAVLGRAPLALPLEDSVQNMRVIDAIVRSAASGRRERP